MGVRTISMLNEYYQDIIDIEVQELMNTFATINNIQNDDSEWFMYDNMKTLAEKFLKLGYLKGVDDCKAAAERLRSQE